MALSNLLMASDTLWVKMKPFEAAAIFEKSNSYYTNQKELCYQTQIESFENYQTSKFSDRKKGRVLMKGKDFIQVFDKQTTIQSGKFNLMIDSVEKALLVTNPTSSGSFQFIPEVTLEILESKTIKRAVLADGAQAIKIEAIEGDIIRYIFYFDQYLRIQQISLFYRVMDTENPERFIYPRMEIKCTNFNTHCNWDMDTYKMENYIIVSKDKIVPVTKYRLFNLLDLRVSKQ
jgi:hypothetical protein